MLPGSMIQQGFPTNGMVDLSYPIYWVDLEDGEILIGFSPLFIIVESLSLLDNTIEGYSPLMDTIETASELE